MVAPFQDFLAVLEQPQVGKDELVAEHLFLRRGERFIGVYRGLVGQKCGVTLVTRSSTGNSAAGNSTTGNST